MHKDNHFWSKRRTLFFKAVFTWCFVILASQLFSASFNDYQPRLADEGCDHLCHVTSKEAVNEHHSNRLPAAPVPSPEEVQIVDIEESSEDSNDELADFTGHFSLALNEIFHSENSLFIELRLSIENRSSVSLIILHHCWKSFIA